MRLIAHACNDDDLLSYGRLIRQFLTRALIVLQEDFKTSCMQTDSLIDSKQISWQE